MTWLWIAGLLAAEPPKPAELAERAAAILDRCCAGCHRGAGSSSGYAFDVRQAPSLLAGEDPVVVKGKPAESAAWVALHKGKMPPPAQTQLPRPTPEEAETVAAWIKAGAPAFAAPKPRPHVGLAAQLTAIRDDLKKQPDEQIRRRLRYFTLAPLHNDPRVTDAQLNLARAGLAKALNSLSWERELAPLRSLDEHGTTLALDLGKLGWTRDDHWKALRAAYPYALGYENLDDPAPRELDREIVHLYDGREPLPMLRADWFQAAALQPPLYHRLAFDLTFPALRRDPRRKMTDRDLEEYLGVDVAANLREGGDRCGRAGFNGSGVSGQNRMVERHRSKFGAYWKSYDFKADNRRAILSQFPLGPPGAFHEFERLAFEHDGGEIVFHLPNGFVGYLLIDGKGGRIDAGPIEVVSDALKTSGTPAIVNGLSCMACHKTGFVDVPADEIRRGASLFGDAKRQLERLYVPHDEFEPLLRADRKQFLGAADAAMLKYLQRGPDAQTALAQFAEPVSTTARRHLLEDLDLAAVAAELGEPNADRLRAKLEHDETLHALGLRVLLAERGRIKRAFWESRPGGASVMQIVASSLGYSTPNFPR